MNHHELATPLRQEPRPAPGRRPAITMRRALAMALLVACGIAVAPHLAHARAQRVVFYTFEQVWPAAIRFLRVDEGFDIVERDMEAGYLLFHVSEEKKRFRGALEIVRFEDESGRPALRLVLRIEDRPSYMEIGVLERLERKLRDELGAPREPEPKPRDKDKDKDKKTSKEKDKGQG